MSEEHTYLRREPSYTDLMVALEEGGDWYHIRIHSLVLDGWRADALSKNWRKYDYTPEEIKANQQKHNGRILRLTPSV